MFTLTIETDNEAFSADPGAEIARIMQTVGHALINAPSRVDTCGKLRDINGNTVGKWEYEPARLEWECPTCHTINEDEPDVDPGDMECVDCHATL